MLINLKNFITNIASNAPIIALFLTFISFVIQTINSTKGQKLSIQEKRYEKLLFPVFNLIEQYNDKLPDEVFIRIEEIIKVNRHLSGQPLLIKLSAYKDNNDSKRYKDLYKYIRDDFCRVSEKLGVPYVKSFTLNKAINIISITATVLSLLSVLFVIIAYFIAPFI